MLKIAAATISSTPNDAFAKQLKRQQQQFDTLMGKVQSMITTLQTHTTQATSTFRQGNLSFGIRERGRLPLIIMVGEEYLEVWAFLHNLDGGQPQPQRPHSQPSTTHPQQEQGNVKTYVDNQCWQCGEMGHLKRNCPTGRECINNPTESQGHSLYISKSTNVGGKKLASENSSSKFLNPDPCTTLIGRANEERIIANDKTVTALLDTGSQVTHISLDYCQLWVSLCTP